MFSSVYNTKSLGSNGTSPCAHKPRRKKPICLVTIGKSVYTELISPLCMCRTANITLEKWTSWHIYIKECCSVFQLQLVRRSSEVRPAWRGKRFRLLPVLSFGSVSEFSLLLLACFRRLTSCFCHQSFPPANRAARHFPAGYSCFPDVDFCLITQTVHHSVNFSGLI